MDVTTHYTHALIQESPSLPQQDFFHCVPLELIERILGLLCWRDLLVSGRVQKKWKQISEESSFLSHYFPIFRFCDFPSYTPVKNIVKILNCYKNNEIDEIKLGCTPLTDSHLENLKEVKTKKISIGRSLDTSTPEGFIKFLQNHVLASPVSVQELIQSNCWDDHVIQEIMNQKLSFKALALQNAFNISAEKFCQFIEQNGLTSPCELRLIECQWIDSQVIEAFIKSKVQFSLLDLSACTLSKENIAQLIQAGCLLPTCEFIFDECGELSGSEIFSFLQSAKIKLKGLYLQHFDVSPDDLAKFICAGGLSSPCKIELQKSLLTPAVLSALANAQVEIKSLVLHGPKRENAEFEQALQFLLTTGRWSTPCALELKGGWITDITIKTLSESHLRIEELALDKASVSSQAFSLLIRSGRLDSQKCALEFTRCDWVDLNIFKALADTKIKLNQLIIDKQANNIIEQGLNQLGQQGLLDELTTLHLSHLSDSLIQILTNHCRSKLIILTAEKCNKEGFMKTFCEPNKEKFKSLQWFALSGNNLWFDEDCKQRWQNEYPNLMYFIRRSDVGIPSVFE